MNLLREARQQQILLALAERGQVTIGELRDSFQISEITIRRDLRELADAGYLQRTYGGAVANPISTAETRFVERMAQRRAEKEAIGRAAAALIPDGKSVFIGSGSTTAYVVNNLIDRKLNVVTNALNVGVALAAAKEVTVVVVGGMLRASELSMIGHIAEQALREVRVDKVLMSIPALSIEHGLSNDFLAEVTTDRTIFAMAPETILVADHTKLNRIASAFVVPIEQVTTLVTDQHADPAFVERLRARGIHVVIAS